MKINKRSLFMALASVLLLTSCFEIQEKVAFNRDGSGTFSLTIDLSQMMEMVKMMGGSPDDMEENPFEDMESDFASQKAELEAIDGISNARIISDEDNYLVGMSFDFEDVDALNKGMSRAFSEEDPTDRIYFQKSRDGYVRTAEFSHGDNMKEEMQSDDMQGMDPSALFADMRYTTVYEFARPVKSVSNSDAMLSSDKKTVTYHYYFFGEKAASSSISNRISF